MKTVKEVSDLTGISIRTLRYYDEIGLLRPAKVTEAGYRLYDRRSLEKLQEIMFCRELDLPLGDIKKMLEAPGYDRKKLLAEQKERLIRKRNRLNGLISLITDVIQGEHALNFEAFSEKDRADVISHMIAAASKEQKESFAEQYGSMEAFRETVDENLKDEKVQMQLNRWYSGKDKALEASLEASGNTEDFMPQQEENERIYRQFADAMRSEDMDEAEAAVEKLAVNYKKLFHLENARALLLDMANEYLKGEKLSEETDRQYGAGISSFIAEAMRRFYGENC